MKIHELTVLPDTPAELQKLLELAYNIYFSWNEEVIDLFKEIDLEAWNNSQSSPVRFLSEASLEKLEGAAKNKNYINKLEKIYKQYQQYLGADTWYIKKYGKQSKANIAYFCCEFGLHQSMPIYSGGLGILAGDHIKAASDLGLPLVGVGLLYRSGYFTQQIDQSGSQVEQYQMNNFYNIPASPVLDKDNNILKMSIDILDEKLYFDIWKLVVGRVEIILLNTHVPQNSREKQRITDVLYVGDRETRLQQELLLGVGGYQVLKHLGYQIDTYHCNEGHSAFLLLEYLQDLMQEHKLSFEEARHFVSESSCFTTHTPVPAGNERFSLDLMNKYFYDRAKALGLSWELFLSLGREYPDNHNEEFCLTVLALKLCDRNNGVSKLHGQVAQNMWQSLYPEILKHEVPISSITNGVHGQTWTDPHLKSTLEHVLSNPSKKALLYDENFYNHIYKISNEILWKWKHQCKQNLISFTREHLVKQYTRLRLKQELIDHATEVLDPDVLTIGFARRFAAYKRGNLFLNNRERLKALIENPSCPVQFVIAGKAHPADGIGKDIIKSIYTAVQELNLEHRIVFLENYNIDIARKLVAGVDVWLNTPIRPQEASGTSGMKAGINGTLNCSISDGWWDEAYNEEIGWVIFNPIETDNLSEMNNRESEIFYTILEKDIVPLYYQRSKNALPEKWITMMKNSIAQIGADYNAIRMLKEYMRTYTASIESARFLKENNFAQLKQFSEWKVRVLSCWADISIVSLDIPPIQKVKRGDMLTIRACVDFGGLTADDVSVECYYGNMDAGDEITDAHVNIMELVEQDKKGKAYYQTEFYPEKGGMFGYTIRILPRHPILHNPYSMGLIYWYE